MLYFWGGILLWYLIIFVYKTKTGSPSVMSQDKHLEKLVRYVKPKMVVADMGCGDGEALMQMVKAGAVKGDGWEIEPWVWLKASWKIRRKGFQKKIKIYFKDMWKADLSKYDLVYVYQLTRYAPRFVNKCKQEMKVGSWVVANTYPLKGLKEVKRDGKLYIYQI